MRSRLYLTRPKGKDDDQPDTNIRLLSRKKANYAPRDAEIVLEWKNGVFVRKGEAAPGRIIQWPEIDQTFNEVEQAWKSSRPWSNAPQTTQEGRYLPAWMELHFGIKKDKAAKLVTTWLTEGYLAVENLSGHSKAKGIKVIRRLQP